MTNGLTNSVAMLFYSQGFVNLLVGVPSAENRAFFGVRGNMRVIGLFAGYAYIYAYCNFVNLRNLLQHGQRVGLLSPN